MTTRSLLAATFIFQSLAIASEATSTRDLEKMDKAVLSVQSHYSQSGSLKSTIPAKMQAGQNGYLIATSEHIKNNSKELAAFIKHKESRGFKVHVATEKDWGVSDTGKGRKQADLAHKWMQENYQKLNLLYTLIISNPHPDEGMVPMVKFKPRKYKVPSPEEKRDYAKYLKYKDNPRTADGKYLKYDGNDPSDYYYADLTSVWDANGNTILADKEDYAAGKIDATAEVYVGRIPYYGEDHAYSNLAGVDKMLRLTIEFENDEKSDTSWRNNLFYVGGADKRFKSIQDEFMPYSGGLIETYRISQGYGYEPTTQKWNNDVILKALNEDKPYGFINFQEHGSPTSMAGQISTKSAVQLKRSKPSYVYLGGCDVASPEHSDNITNALFYHTGIGAMGASRSVTGLGGDDDTNSAASYERLFFGQSMGEAHWQLLSDYGDGMKKVGASNFLMNLLGDPSVVVFPKLNERPLILGPNMETLKFHHQEKSKSPIGYPMTVRNQTRETQSYHVTTEGTLASDTSTFELAPYSSRKLNVYFKDADNLSVGKHSGKLSVTTGDVTEERRFELDVFARSAILNLAFNSPTERKIFAFAAKGDAAERLKKELEGTEDNTFLTVPGKNRGDLKSTKLVVGESDMTLTARLKYDATTKGPIEFIRLGKTFTGFDTQLVDEKLVVRYITTVGLADKEAEGRVELPAPPAGKWFQLVASVNRAEQTMSVNVNGKTYSAPFTAQPGQSIPIDRVRFGNNKNRTDIHVDSIAIFDYSLGKSEIASAYKGDTIKQAFPKNHDKAHPKGVNVSWTYAGTQKKPQFILAYATDPKFTDKQFVQTSDSGTVLTDLKDKTTYYWRVGLVKNGKKVFPWKYYTTFTTDSSIQDAEVTINAKRGLKAAEVKDNNYSDNLNKIASALLPPDSNGKRKRATLHFTKVEGASWLRCHSDGTLTTNFGAPKSGTYKFKFSVSTRYGIPQTFEKVIVAK